MRRNPRLLAWIILLTSFFTCVALAVLAPLGGRWYILNSCVRQEVGLEVQRAPLRVTEPGRSQPVSVAEDPDDRINEHTTIATYASAGRLVVRAPQKDGPVIATVQLYDDTEVVLLSTRSPRFSVSRLPHQIVLEIETGRTRINISGDDGRDTIAKVKTPHGVATLREGSYEVRVNMETEVTVHRGRADLEGFDAPVGPGERAFCGEEHAADRVLPAPTNLVSNGDFQSPLEGAWDKYAEQAEEPPGDASVVTDGERRVVKFYRSGIDHSSVAIQQEINQDIRGFKSLELHLSVYIAEHDVPVCGSLGSECPVMVRIVYEDANGAEQEWLQGFYSVPNTGASDNPEVCRTCGTKNPHIRVQEDTWYPYLSSNLILLLSSQDGEAPTAIKTVTVYASGHSYESMVTEVELIGQREDAR